MCGFEGRILVACGDFRQIPPVVPGGDKWSVIDASVRSSPLWRQFHVMELTVSHRHANDPEYSAFVQAIGEGTVGEGAKVADTGRAGSADVEPIPTAKIVPLKFLRASCNTTLAEEIRSEEQPSELQPQ